MATLDVSLHDTTTFPAYTPDDVGKLVMRLSVGLLMLLHGISKLVNGPDAGRWNSRGCTCSAPWRSPCSAPAA
jgi:uncharacterized membrane protein YphA (DoxX/SURF4 family)